MASFQPTSSYNFTHNFDYGNYAPRQHKLATTALARKPHVEKFPGGRPSACGFNPSYIYEENAPQLFQTATTFSSGPNGPHVNSIPGGTPSPPPYAIQDPSSRANTNPHPQVAPERTSRPAPNLESMGRKPIGENKVIHNP